MNRCFFALMVALLCPGSAFARVEAVHFRGALLDDEAPLRLSRAAVYFQEGGPGETPVEQLTREQLQVEYQRLDAERPGLGAPIVLTAVGGGLLIIGAGILVAAVAELLYFGTRGVYGVVGYVYLALSAALIVTGAVLLTVGLVKLFARIAQRRGYTQRMEDINTRLESLDRTGSPPAPPAVEPSPPAPPLPPPGAGFFPVRPGYVMATF